MAQVIYVKSGAERDFLIVDAAMNDLVRPSMYDAHHDIIPVVEPAVAVPLEPYDVVGPVCESGDWLAKGRELAIASGDLLAILSAGAYAAQMSSNYNSRPRAPELLISDGRAHVVRARDSVADLFAGERTLG